MRQGAISNNTANLDRYLYLVLVALAEVVLVEGQGVCGHLTAYLGSPKRIDKHTNE